MGEIYLNDSTGQTDTNPYNYAKWDGNNWKIGRAPYLYQGHSVYNSIRWVFAVAESDIWFENSVIWNGKSFVNVDIGTSIFLGIGSRKMWGSPDGQFYVVGNSGTIAYSQDHGLSWSAIPSGTSLDFEDIWGRLISPTSQTEVLAVAARTFQPPNDRKLVLLRGTSILTVPDSGLPIRLSGVWISPANRYYLVGDGIYSKSDITSSDPWISLGQGMPVFYAESIRGNADNDIVVAGDFGLLLHYNGQTWRSFQNQVPPTNTLFHSAAIKGNLIIAVGENGANAVAQIGRR